MPALLAQYSTTGTSQHCIETAIDSMQWLHDHGFNLDVRINVGKCLQREASR
jgi:hypothetical protein